jgi:hypothetical protein
MTPCNPSVTIIKRTIADADAPLANQRPGRAYQDRWTSGLATATR